MSTLAIVLVSTLCVVGLMAVFIGVGFIVLMWTEFE